MEIYQLRYFLAVAKEQNYSKAAESLFISRQALAKAIKRLEEELGGRLFITKNGRIHLTDLGRVLQKESSDLMQYFQTFETKVNTKTLSKQEVLKIAICHGVSIAIPPLLWTTFHSAFPNIMISSEEMCSSNVTEAVTSGHFDLGLIGSIPSYLSSYDCYLLRHTGTYLHINTKNPLSKKQTLRVEDLVNEPIVGFGPQNHLHHYFVSKCREKGFEPKFSMITSDVAVSLELLRQNLSICFGFAPNVQKTEDGFSVLRELVFEDEESFGTYAIARKGKALSFSGRAFLEFLHAQAF